MKKMRFSLVSRVSGDLHVLHVTYSTMLQWNEIWTMPNEENHTNVPPQNVFHLFLLESSFDDQLTVSIDGACGTHFREEELYNVFGLDQEGVRVVGDGDGSRVPVCAFSCKCRLR